MGTQMEEEVLGYDHVDICYNGVPVVHDVSASVRPGETLGIVGKSGSGKSTLLKAAMGLLGSYGTVTHGDIWLDGSINLTDLPERELRSLCGPRMGMVFQDCISALTPTRRVADLVWESAATHMEGGIGKKLSGKHRRRDRHGKQAGGQRGDGIDGHRQTHVVGSTAGSSPREGGDHPTRETSAGKAHTYDPDTIHRQIPQESREQVLDRAARILGNLNVSEPDRVLQSYPFELSGGLGQRVGMMMALLMEPSVLLADEPTSALDVVSQKQVVEQLRRIADETGMAMVVVSHNIGVVRELADRVLVLEDGKVMESGPAEQVLEHPRSAYTQQLLDAVPVLESGPGTERAERDAGNGRKI